MLGPGSRFVLWPARKDVGVRHERRGDGRRVGIRRPEAGLLDDAKTADALKEVGDASIVGVLPLHTLLPIIVPEEAGARFRAAVPVAPGGAPPPPPKPAGVSPFKLKL